MPLADAVYAQISGGERQLTTLAADGDGRTDGEPRFRQPGEVLERIAEMAHSGIGVLLSTHDPDQAFLLGHRVALLHGATLAALGRPQDVLAPAALPMLYGVDIAISRVGEAAFGERAVCVPRIGTAGHGPVM